MTPNRSGTRPNKELELSKTKTISQRKALRSRGYLSSAGAVVADIFRVDDSNEKIEEKDVGVKVTSAHSSHRVGLGLLPHLKLLIYFYRDYGVLQRHKL